MIKETIFSPCRNYRYTLWREWGVGKGVAMFIGLNPSTADEVNNDPTVRRCINYAVKWGYAAMYMSNIFAFRATDPAVMMKHDEPIGCENDQYLTDMAKDSNIIVAAWGNHGAFMARDYEVKKLLSNLHCLRVTKAGQPSHPLYLPSSLVPIKFN
ncbi:DUF1643 domain-containing protein [Nitrosomonas communis]|uniref:DUF1643 domain-containing protein n=1 Tax=Nitrosomonas communis TaxID=44574 RepID=UPI003D2D7FD4